MKDFLRKAFGKVQLNNPEDVPNSVISLLEKSFSKLDSLHKGLGEELVKYVIDGGEAEESLLVLAGLNDAALNLNQRKKQGAYFMTAKSSERRSFFSNSQEIPSVVVYRACRVYATSLGAFPHMNWRWDYLNTEERWLEILFEELLQFDQWGNMNHKIQLPAEAISRVCMASDQGSSLFAKHILECRWNHWHSLITGIGEYLSSEEPILTKYLSEGSAAERVANLEILSKEKAILSESMIALVCKLAVGTSKTVREASNGLINVQEETGREFAIDQFKGFLKSGSAAERFNAIGVLVRLQGDSCYPYLKECLESEKGKKVKAELEKYLCVQAAGSDENDHEEKGYDDGLVAPIAQSFPVEISLPKETEEAFYNAIDRFNEKAMADHTKRWNQTDSRWRRGPSTISPPINAKNARKIYQGLLKVDEVQKQDHVYKRKNFYYQCGLAAELREFGRLHHLSLVPTIRLAFLCGFISSANSNRNNYYRGFYIQEDGKDLIREVFERSEDEYSLLDLSSAFESAGLDNRWVEELYARPQWGEQFNPLELKEDQIWPFFLVHQNLLKDVFGLIKSTQEIPTYYYGDYKQRVYKILATFPRPPKDFTPYLWEQALGTSKTERPLAQACLSNYPNREVIIIAALQDGKKDVRTSAATWLGELGVEDAIPALKSLLKKEKYDEVKAAAIGALESLGVDIDQFLNRKKLLEEAEKGLKKPLHKELVWFPFENLPTVHWEKNKQKVPVDIVKWFIVQAFKVKKPHPNPLMRRYFSLMRPKEREKLGKFVLDSWLTQDTKPAYTHAEAAQKADASLQQTKQWVKQMPQYYPNFNDEQFRKTQLNYFLNECIGSANSSKGILAIAACCCGVDIVPQVEKYIRFWYGKRLHQGKALLQMLSWVDHPLAIQLVLAIANRFRTKGIQNEAGVCADSIAERKGWSRDEMADRTIPTAGFNRAGMQMIDYGMRQFEVKLMDDFSIELKNAEGKVIKALPNANKAEDEDEVKALKKDFTASKKELKQVIKLQKERLYEAMCTERQWLQEEWDIYLNQHPIVGRFCQQLVWVALDGEGGQVKSFRPLADGTLTDVDDEEVELDESHTIKLAHQTFLSKEEVESWEEHLSDYEITPLFAQFGKKLFKTDTEFSKKSEIDEFYGHLVNSFKLRSRTNKQGYNRGAAEDGGWFYTYQKTFPGLRIQAVIEFTGNGLPEEDRTLALQSLYFTRLKDDRDDTSAYSHRRLKLNEIPEVMLSECWNDIKLMADDGSGFDKDWEKISAY